MVKREVWEGYCAEPKLEGLEYNQTHSPNIFQILWKWNKFSMLWRSKWQTEESNDDVLVLKKIF